MIDYDKCKVYCDVCKKYLGDYNLGIDENGNEKSYQSLIATKYCEEHTKAARRKSNRKAQRNYNKRKRVKNTILQEENRVIQEQLSLIKSENNALKIRLFGTENAEQHRALIDLLNA